MIGAGTKGLSGTPGLPDVASVHGSSSSADAARNHVTLKVQPDTAIATYGLSACHVFARASMTPNAPGCNLQPLGDGGVDIECFDDVHNPIV